MRLVNCEGIMVDLWCGGGLKTWSMVAIYVGSGDLRLFGSFGAERFLGSLEGTVQGSTFWEGVGCSEEDCGG